MINPSPNFEQNGSTGFSCPEIDAGTLDPDSIFNFTLGFRTLPPIPYNDGILGSPPPNPMNRAFLYTLSAYHRVLAQANNYVFH